MKRTLAIAVAALLAVVGTAFAAGLAGTYKGKTRQGLGITLTITGKGLSSASYTANYKCRRRNGTSGHSSAQPTKLGSSRFKGRGRINTNQSTTDGSDRTHLVARISGKRISGYFNETYRNNAGTVCHSGNVSFSAKR